MFDVSAMDLSALLPFILVGFAAQLVDGALGMAFGVITSTLLVGVLGVPPAQASARVHLVEIFTTGVSGVSHLLHRNIDARLFWRLLIPGVIGGVVGAYLLSNISGETVKPFVLVYLISIGLWLLWRGLDHQPHIRDPKIVAPLGLIGGFLDAAGGGGWGSVVTSNLLIQGAEPRKVIGTVNSVEFFLTVAISAAFIWNLGIEHFGVAVVGLLIGGMAAAPMGAMLAKRVPAKALLLMVGVVLTLTSSYGLYRAIAG
ncbi:MAG: sulfite exporter TauE/SafE family protein [Sphingomonadaceae bacterium]|nr:sulfite exporter TauE/SafE family protein [Sphingomonadaceae bacterium]